MDQGYGLLRLTNTLSVFSLLVIVTEIGNTNIRIVICRNSIMLLRRIRDKGILEVIHNVIDVSIGYPRKNIIIGLRLFNTLKVTTKELFRR